jgi:hypothetical protein
VSWEVERQLNDRLIGALPARLFREPTQSYTNEALYMLYIGVVRVRRYTSRVILLGLRDTKLVWAIEVVFAVVLGWYPLYSRGLAAVWP